MSIPLSAGATLHPLVVPARADAADAGSEANRTTPTIDEASGFIARASEGAWKKELT